MGKLWILFRVSGGNKSKWKMGDTHACKTYRNVVHFSSPGTHTQKREFSTFLPFSGLFFEALGHWKPPSSSFISRTCVMPSTNQNQAARWFPSVTALILLLSFTFYIKMDRLLVVLLPFHRLAKEFWECPPHWRQKETTSCTDEAASPADNLIIHHLAKTQTTDEEFFFSIVALWTIFPQKKPCRAHPKEYSEQFINNSRVVDVTTKIKSLPSFLLLLSYEQHLTSAVCQCSQEINLASSLTASNERGDNQNS